MNHPDHAPTLTRTTHCRRCQQPGRFVRTRYFPGEESDVYECTNPACASFNSIWHTDRKVPLNYYGALELARNRAQEAGYVGLAGAFQQLMRKEHP
jgi:hypothetical protein